MQTEADFIAAQITTLQTRLKAISAQPVKQPGVCLAGGCWGNNVPGRLNSDYAYPNEWEFLYWSKLGFKEVRFAFLWERMQPAINGELSAPDKQAMDNAVAWAAKYGLGIILDCHNYCKRFGVPLNTGPQGIRELGNLWWRISNSYKGLAHVSYGIMNEPVGLSLPDWKAQLIECVKAIQLDNPNNPIFASWGSWGGAWNMLSSGGDATFTGLPANTNLVIELHQYLDKDSAGDTTSVVAGKGATVLVDVTAWARKNGYKLFLGEFGFAMGISDGEGAAMVEYMGNNSDLWLGWTFWKSAPVGFGRTDAFCVQRENPGDADAPQIAVLKRFMA